LCIRNDDEIWHVTIAAKPVVTLLVAGVNRPTVAVFPASKAFRMLLAAPFKVWEARLVYTIEDTVVVGLYNLKSAVVIVRIYRQGSCRQQEQ
jgi:hypothetical protein